MTLMNISLVQPNYSFNNNYWLPYSVASVYAYAKSHYSFLSLNQIIFRREKVSRITPHFSQDTMVLFSNYMWNWEYNLKLAKSIKNSYPNILIVFGGPQVSENNLLHQINTYPFVDSWVVGEGEQSFCNIISDYLKGSIQKQYSIIKRMPDLDIPSPYLTGIFDAVIAKHPSFLWNTTLETNRGCPFKCTFCDWGSLTFSKVEKFSLEKVYAELEWLAKNKVEFVTVADANFGMLKERDNLIADKILEVQDTYGYPKVFTYQWHKNSKQDVIGLAKKLTSNGMNRGLTLSVQSMSDKVLKEIERKNMDTSHLSSMLDSMEEQSVTSYTELILPLPYETKSSWREGLCEILEIGQHNSIEVWFHQLFENAPGAQTSVREKHGYKTNWLTDYVSGDPPADDEDDVKEKTEVVVSTNDMSFKDFIDSYMYASMIVNFHSGGWTQLLARYSRYALNISYRQFYDYLYAKLEQDFSSVGDSWRLIRKKVIAVTTDSHDDIIKKHSLLFELNYNFHTNPQDVFDFIKNYFYWLSDDLHILQKELIYTEHSSNNKEITCSSNLLDYMKNLKTIPTLGEYKYNLTHESSENHFLSLYTKRRSGYGKYKVL